MIPKQFIKFFVYAGILCLWTTQSMSNTPEETPGESPQEVIAREYAEYEKRWAQSHIDYAEHKERWTQLNAQQFELMDQSAALKKKRTALEQGLKLLEQQRELLKQQRDYELCYAKCVERLKSLKPPSDIERTSKALNSLLPRSVVSNILVSQRKIYLDTKKTQEHWNQKLKLLAQQQEDLKQEITTCMVREEASQELVQVNKELKLLGNKLKQLVKETHNVRSFLPPLLPPLLPPSTRRIG